MAQFLGPPRYDRQCLGVVQRLVPRRLLPDPAVNPVGPAGTERVLRGGAYDGDNTTGSLARSASREKDMPENYGLNRGFRLVIPK